MTVAGIWQLCPADFYPRQCSTLGDGILAGVAAVLEVTVRQHWEYAAVRGAFMRVLRISVAVVAFVALVGSVQAQQAAQAALPVPSVKVGEMAPDFTLLDQNRKQVSLKDFRGKQNVALAFYVFAFSPG
jgi:hypothetical protein